MLVHVKRDELLAIAAQTAKAAPKTATSEAVLGIHVEADSRRSMLTLTATNYEIVIRASMGASVEQSGSVVISAALFPAAIVYFQSIQLRLIDTILVEKERNTPPTPVRYGDAFESMYILAKGKPKTVHILKDKPNKWAGTKTWGCLTKREVNGTLTPKGRKTIQKFGARTNVWHYGTVLPMESELFGGKAVSLSERLAEDHIRTWSNEGDLVLAPFDKDGTVAKIAPLLERRWLSLQNAADCDGLRDNAG